MNRPCIRTPVLKRKKNGQQKAADRKLAGVGRKLERVGVTATPAAAAKAATATGGVDRRHARVEQGRHVHRHQRQAELADQHLA